MGKGPEAATSVEARPPGSGEARHDRRGDWCALQREIGGNPGDSPIRNPDACPLDMHRQRSLEKSGPSENSSENMAVRRTLRRGARPSYLTQIAASAACARSISFAPIGLRDFIISMNASKR